MIFDVHKHGIKYLHLKKSILKKEQEIVIVPFHEIERYINFTDGVYIHSNICNDFNRKSMDLRIKCMINKHIPYALRNKYGFNCENFLYFLLLGIKIESSEVKRFEEKFGKIGNFLVFCFDKFMTVTNFIGEIYYFLQSERKNNK